MIFSEILQKNLKKVPLEDCMSKLLKSWKNPAVLTLGILILFSLLTTCTNVIGFGDPIDFQPPELKLDPGPNPRYITLDYTLTGMARDNVAVARVICIDTATGKQIGNAFFTGTRNGWTLWSMKLNLSGYNGGDQIAAQVIAEDRVGNKGDTAMAMINFIVDLRPPLFNEVAIHRSEGVTMELLPYNELKYLESSNADADRFAKNQQFVNYYQNGSFWIRARVSEAESHIKKLEMVLYDSEHLDEPLLTKVLDEYSLDSEGNDVNLYAPEWIITEKGLIDAAVSKGWDVPTK